MKKKSCCVYNNLTEYFGRLEKSEVKKTPKFINHVWQNSYKRQRKYFNIERICTQIDSEGKVLAPV